MSKFNNAYMQIITIVKKSIPLLLVAPWVPAVVLTVMFGLLGIGGVLFGLVLYYFLGKGNG